MSQFVKSAFLVIVIFFLSFLWGKDIGTKTQNSGEVYSKESRSSIDWIKAQEEQLILDLQSQNLLQKSKSYQVSKTQDLKFNEVLSKLTTTFSYSNSDLSQNKSNQKNEKEEPKEGLENIESQKLEPPVLKKPIEGWGNLKLGLDFDEIKTVLSNEYPWMVLRPSVGLGENSDPDKVFFLETFKNDFFTKVQFQFDKNRRLYLLRLEMNSRYFSFLNLYNNLFERYGFPQENSYVRVIWQDETRTLELYRNNVVVYVDKEEWEEKLPVSEIEDQRKKLLDTVFDNL